MVDRSSQKGPVPQVTRPRLTRRLDEGRRRDSRLFLVVAPAGYGKTTLLREWLAKRKAALLWHTLDEADNDPAHLLAGIAAGLRAALPALHLPEFDRQNPLAYALSLLFRQASAAAQRDWLLLLDDYQLITNPSVHQALDTLLGQPSWPVRLVLASRSLPPLAAVARLRVEGRLLELDETDLRFTLEEVREFLADGGLPLGEEALRQVAARTEGWPVAPQLLCQAAQRETAPDLSAILQRGEAPVPAAAWQRRKTRQLLLYLLTRRGPVPCDEVLEALWPDLSPAAAGQALNTAFSELRRLLEPHLDKGIASRYRERDEETLAWRRDAPYWYDAAAFEQAVRSGGQAARQALELYRGDFLPEEPYVDWVLRERERLRGLYLNALGAWLEERLQAGEWREGIELARRILEMEPWLEEVWRALMTCYAMLGRRSEALQAYHSCVHALRTELDVAPSSETQALHDQIRDGGA